MVGRLITAGHLPTPGPCLVRGDAREGAVPADAMLGVNPATEDRPGGWPYLIGQMTRLAPGGCPYTSPSASSG